MPPDTSACPGNPNGGHWWIIDTPSGRFSSGYCKLCKLKRNDFDNIYPEYVYGHLVGRERKEHELRLSADERSKRHAFYEQHKEEVIEAFKKHESARETAEELSEKWKVEVPTTTIYGLLRKWGIERKARASKKDRKRKKGKEKIRTLALVPPAEPPGAPATRFTGQVTAIEMNGKGLRVTLTMLEKSFNHIGSLVLVELLPDPGQ